MDAIHPKFSMKNESHAQYFTIVVRLKTLETCYFDIPNLDDAMKLTESLDALIKYTGKYEIFVYDLFEQIFVSLDGSNYDVTYLFPFCFRRDFDIIEDGWMAFSIELEFSRLKTISDEWRISNVNKNFAVCLLSISSIQNHFCVKICETYPERLIVPKLINDEYLRYSASYRHHGRFPLLSYLHKTSKSCIIRSSQLLVGADVNSCKEDEALVNAMLPQRHQMGWILDTRHRSILLSEFFAS
jgi:myotubularin-related protein 9